MPRALAWWRAQAHWLRTQAVTLALVVRHHQTPWPARLVAGLAVAYALSPIDLIPDVIPVLGQLDDLLLVPLGVALALRLTPPAVVAACRAQAAALGAGGQATPRWARLAVAGTWALLALVALKVASAWFSVR